MRSRRPPAAFGRRTSSPLALVARAEAALGAPAVRERAAAFHARHSGTTFANEQAADPAEPAAEARRGYRWTFDPAAGRMIREAEQIFPGEIRFLTLAALTPDGGWSADLLRWRTGTDLAVFGPADSVRAVAQFERFFPHLLLRQARGATGGVASAGADVFRYSDPAGETIDVALDPASGLPLRSSHIVDGRAQSEIFYFEYGRRAGLLVPGRLEIRQSGRLQEQVRLEEMRLGRAPDADYASPAGYAAPPPPGTPHARELAPGFFYFDSMPGGYHSAAVDLGDRLLLVEAPLNAAYAALQKRLLGEFRPGKPVGHILVTHPHADHAAGLKAWHDEGATIVAARGGRQALERQLRAAGAQGALRIEEVEESRAFVGGGARVDTYAFAGSHSAANLLVHLPARRILFQGDLFFIPERGPVPPAFAVSTELLAEIERLGLAVETIVGVHGRIGTMAELRASIAAAPR